MNMSEEVTGVTLLVTEKALTTGLNATTRIVEMIARVFREMLEMSRQRNAGKMGGSTEKVRETDLTDLKPGYAALSGLEKSALKTGDTIATSEHGMNREDMKAVCHKAKKYGVPVAFKNPKGKDNIYACVRGSDLPVFKQICTEVIQDKMAEKPEKLGNIKCEDWEIPFFAAEAKKLDVAAVFPTSDQGSFCLYEAKDEKLIRAAREEVIRKYTELDRDVTITKDEEGFYSVTEKRSGRTVSFDEIPTRTKLSEQIQLQFGYDENKADMCVAKLAQELLHGKARDRLITPLLQEDFSILGSMTHLDGEHPLASHYQCWHMKPRDGVECIVFRDGETGRFAVLEPLKMSKRKMRAILTDQLNTTDKEILHALTDKADRLAQHFEREQAEIYTENRFFTWDSFTPEQLVEYRHNGASGEEYIAKLRPIDSVEQTIDRSGRNMFGSPDKDAFTVSAAFTATEIGADGKGIEKKTVSKLELSLADKKTGLNILTEMYKEHGIPNADAQKMARSVFEKARKQSTEHVVRLEEVHEETMKMVCGAEFAEVTTADKRSAAQKITERFGIPFKDAEEIVEKAEEAKKEALEAPLNVEAENVKKAAGPDKAKRELTKAGNGHETHKAPTQDLLDRAGAKPAKGTPTPLPDAPKLRPIRR